MIMIITVTIFSLLFPFLYGPNQVNEWIHHLCVHCNLKQSFLHLSFHIYSFLICLWKFFIFKIGRLRPSCNWYLHTFNKRIFTSFFNMPVTFFIENALYICYPFLKEGIDMLCSFIQENCKTGTLSLPLIPRESMLIREVKDENELYK